jgi:hypothetical protein
VGTQCWGKQQHLSSAVFASRFPEQLHMELFKHVRELNSQLQGGQYRCIYDAKHCE